MPTDSAKKDVSPHVHAKVGEETKKRWLEYAHEHHRGNLSSLIVEAVDQTISDHWVLESEAQSKTENIDVDLSGVDEELEDVQEQLIVLSRQIDGLTVADATGGEKELEESELIRLANLIYDTLPSAPSEWAFTHLMKYWSELEPKHRPKISGNADDLADYHEESRYHIQDAAIYLENKDESVKSVIDSGIRRWYIHRPDSPDEWKWVKELNEHSDVDAADLFDTGVESDKAAEEAAQRFQSIVSEDGPN
ncbi:hypothetical protein [Candidatus Halobonum tyrrellensis]|uniref:hypothetical protein n=1 Tax=Candidatus Halobonum tyrrellensis TaxID=1431545 RepID=UPI0012693964|nr:hypothetical protein [Candidatus Halobonum tyrrellensis]